MPPHPLPRDLHRALERLQAEPERAWTLASLAAACGVAPRTLQKHFRRFLGRTPVAFLRELRLDQARQQLLRPAATTSVTDVAAGCGFNHLGRFAAWYLRRYGESPSATLKRCQGAVAHVPAKWTPVRRQEHAPHNDSGTCSDSEGTEDVPVRTPSLPLLSSAVERPAIAVLPFTASGPPTALSDEIAAELCRL